MQTQYENGLPSLIRIVRLNMCRLDLVHFSSRIKSCGKPLSTYNVINVDIFITYKILS